MALNSQKCIAHFSLSINHAHQRPFSSSLHPTVTAIVKSVKPKGLFSTLVDEGAIHHCNHPSVFPDCHFDELRVEPSKVKCLVKPSSIRALTEIAIVTQVGKVYLATSDENRRKQRR
jgi:hypothetical protein